MKTFIQDQNYRVIEYHVWLYISLVKSNVIRLPENRILFKLFPRKITDLSKIIVLLDFLYDSNSSSWRWIIRWVPVNRIYLREYFCITSERSRIIIFSISWTATVRRFRAVLSGYRIPGRIDVKDCGFESNNLFLSDIRNGFTFFAWSRM